MGSTARRRTLALPAQQGRRTLGGLHDVCDSPPVVGGQGLGLPEQLGPTEDHGEQVVELVDRARLERGAVPLAPAPSRSPAACDARAQGRQAWQFTIRWGRPMERTLSPPGRARYERPSP